MSEESLDVLRADLARVKAHVAAYERTGSPLPVDVHENNLRMFREREAWLVRALRRSTVTGRPQRAREALDRAAADYAGISAGALVPVTGIHGAAYTVRDAVFHVHQALVFRRRPPAPSQAEPNPVKEADQWAVRMIQQAQRAAGLVEFSAVEVRLLLNTPPEPPGSYSPTQPMEVARAIVARALRQPFEAVRRVP